MNKVFEFLPPSAQAAGQPHPQYRHSAVPQVEGGIGRPPPKGGKTNISYMVKMLLCKIIAIWNMALWYTVY